MPSAKDTLTQGDANFNQSLGTDAPTTDPPSNTSQGNHGGTGKFELKFVDEPKDGESAWDHLNVLLYGGPGSSKTTGSMTLPRPMLVMNAETKNAMIFPREKYGSKGILEYPILTEKDIRDCYLYVRKSLGYPSQ